jgi:hypothetical protein
MPGRRRRSIHRRTLSLDSCQLSDVGR